MSFSATVLGASGYAGGELLRLLAGHRAITVVAVGAERAVGRPLAAVVPQMTGALELDFRPVDEVVDVASDILFSCLPHGEFPKLLDDVRAPVIVDLADDHRAAESWVYGLPELSRSQFPATRVANPGCYPTAALLALHPFAQAQIIEGPVIVDAMSGVSGAGRRVEDHLSFSNMHGEVRAYGSVDHRHVPEIEGGLLASGLEATVSFTPHLVPLARGLAVTARARLQQELDDETALDLLAKAYPNEPFVRVVETWPSVKAVAGSNGCHVSAKVDARNGWLIASAAIDNLGKGAAGQAVQNANLCLGLDETAGLTAIGVWP